ncbi:hypothetical protein MYX76_16535 [Desulfobacterota bacterium AH_259_B03_O07]|nr:hypothetical protein [Desulfobacterota bacterium AH_259_B03_O07]
MCDSELIAAILEELGYLEEKKEEDKKKKVKKMEAVQITQKTAGKNKKNRLRFVKC